MPASYLRLLLPAGLTLVQRKECQRRQRIAENTLEIQSLGGTLPDNETIYCFQRYVNGNLTLEAAMMRLRQQMLEERAIMRDYIQRRTIE